MRNHLLRTAVTLAAGATTAALMAVVVPTKAAAQQTPPAAQGQPAMYQQFAPIDLTGTWVALITEDWRFRMMTPPKGDYEGLPLTPAARQAADAWDPARDTGDNACKAYGAPALMRTPTRVRVTWQDNGNTLRMDADNGTQTRLLYFGDAPAVGARDWQGRSVATWEYAGNFNPLYPNGLPRGGRAAAPPAAPGAGAPPAGGRGAGAAAGGGGGRAAGAPPAGAPAAGAPPAGGPAAAGRGGAPGGGGGRGGPQGGSLKIVTTNLRAGYLRKNGVPYSENTVLTESFNLLTEPNGMQWLVVTSSVRDPQNLLVDFITSSQFKREADNTKFRPSACTAQ